jgi:hypothetical protein
MARFDADADRKTVAFSASRHFCSPEAVELAARVFETKAEAAAKPVGDFFEVRLKSKKRTPVSAEELEALAGEFLNEVLNQEYRFLVGRFNAKIADLIATQTLYCARGSGKRVKPRSEASPKFKASVDALMKTAREEIKRTMPGKIPPKGAFAA